MLNQYAVDNPHVASQPVFFPPHPIPEGMLSRFIGMPSRREGPPSIWDTHGISGNVFANPTASSSAPYPQESNPRSFNVSEHTSPHVMSESQTSVQDQRCQSGPSAKNSVIPCEGDFSQNYGAKSSCFLRGIQMPNFEVLDAKIASALNRIFHNTQYKRKVIL